MQLRRSRRKRAQKQSWRLAVMLTIIGAAAILCGWLINTLLVQGYLWAPARPGVGQVEEPLVPDDAALTDDEAEEQVPEQSVTISWPANTVYLTQVGAMGNEAGANKLILQLQEQGYAGAYHFDGKIYRVFAGIYANKGAADALGATLRTMKMDAFTKEMAWEGGQWTLSGSEGAYWAKAQPVLENMAKILTELLRGENLTESAGTKFKSNLQTALQVLQDAAPAHGLGGLHRDLLNAGKKMQEAVDQFSQYISTNNDRRRIAAESALIEFVQLYCECVAQMQSKLK